MKTYVFSVIINNIANYLPNEGFIGIHFICYAHVVIKKCLLNILSRMFQHWLIDK